MKSCTISRHIYICEYYTFFFFFLIFSVSALHLCNQECHIDAFSSTVNLWKYARILCYTPVFTSTSSLCLCRFLSLLPVLCLGRGFQGSLGTALNKPTQVSVSSCIYLPLRFTSLFLHYTPSEQTQTLIFI